MKKVIAFITVTCLTISGVFSQEEHLIEYDRDYSVVTSRIIKKDQGQHFLYAFSTRYSESDTLRYVHGHPDKIKSVVNIDNDGTVNDYRNFEFDFFAHEFKPAVGNYYMGTAHIEDTKSSGNFAYPCKKLVLGVVDTTGLMDTTVQSAAAYVDPDCDYEAYLGMTFKSGYFYILYNYKDASGSGINLLKLDQYLTTPTKTQISEVINQAYVKPDNSGFYILCQNPLVQYECRLAEMDFSGNINYLSSYMSFSTEQDQPSFVFDGQYIYTRPRNFYNYTEVRKYDLSGNLKGTYDSGFITEKMYPIANSLLVIQRAEYWNGDPKPLKIAMITSDFGGVYGEYEFGHKNLHTHDYLFDYKEGTLTIVGATQNQHLIPSERNKDDIYFFYAKDSDLFPPTAFSESDEDGIFYPNPNQDTSVYLKLNEGLTPTDEITDIQFYDIRGSRINPEYKKISAGFYEINSSNLANGVYLGVALSNEKEVVSQLLVVRK